MIDFDRKGTAYFVILENFGLGGEVKDILENQLSIDNFIEKAIALCKLKS